MTEAAAGDRWSERMNRDPDSHAQLSAGSKKERLTPGQREGEQEREKEREGRQKDREVVPDSSRSHSVYRESFSGEGEPFSCNQGAACSVFITLGEETWTYSHI